MKKGEIVDQKTVQKDNRYVNNRMDFGKRSSESVRAKEALLFGRVRDLARQVELANKVDPRDAEKLVENYNKRTVKPFCEEAFGILERKARNYETVMNDVPATC